MTLRSIASLVGAGLVITASMFSLGAQAQTLELWSYLPANTESDDVKSQAVGKIVEAFKKSNPGYDVNVTIMPWQQLSPSLLRASKAGQVPDVVMLFSPSVQLQIAAGTLVSLQPYIDKWPEDVRKDLVRLSQNATPKGGVYAVPWQMRVSGLMNHPGNRGGCLVKVRQVPQRVLQVDDSIVPQLLPEECRQLTPAGVDG